jgi:hypothetical protein
LTSADKASRPSYPHIAQDTRKTAKIDARSIVFPATATQESGKKTVNQALRYYFTPRARASLRYGLKFLPGGV